MSEIRGASSGSSRRPDEEEAERRAAEDSAGAKARPATATATAGSVAERSGGDDRSPALQRYMPLPATNDALLRAFTENSARSQALPAALADLSLYTPEALRREIDKLETKIGAHGGTRVEGDRVFLGKLHAELVRQETPPPVVVHDLPTRAAVETAMAAERTFLARHGGALAPVPLAEHRNTLAALEMRRETFLADEHSCRDAKPVAVTLRDGVHRIDFTADDLVASLRTQLPLSREQEAQVRGTFERWHRDTCRLTGEDPTVAVSTRLHAEADIDRPALDRQMLKMRLEMLDASRSSGLAALAFLDSAVRGDSVEVAHARVMAESKLGDAIGAGFPAYPSKPMTPVVHRE